MHMLLFRGLDLVEQGSFVNILTSGVWSQTELISVFRDGM